MDPRPSAAPLASPVAAAPLRGARAWALAVCFVAAYVLLDWVSYVFPVEPFAITPWNPSAGLSVAFLLLAGLRFAPALALAALLADVLVRWGGVHLGLSAASSVIIASCYAAVAAFLLRFARIDPALARVRDVAWLVGTAIPASFAVAWAYVGLHAAAGPLPREALASSALRFWIGDMIGIIVTTPVVLSLATRRGSGEEPRGALETLLQGGALGAALAVVLWVGPSREPRFFYLLFPPVIWIALRRGLRGTVLAVLGLQVALIAALQLHGFAVSEVLEFQLLLLSLALVGLFLGIAVAERARARDALARREAELRATLDTAPDGLVTLDASGTVKAANPAARAILWAGDGLVGATIASLVPGFPTLPVEVRGLELVAARPAGAGVPVEVSVAATPGIPEHIVTLRDVSRRRQAEERLRQKEDELAAVLRVAAAGQVASSLAHELNQPLQALSTYVQSCRILAERPDADRAQLADLMERAVREAARAGEVVRRLREFFQTGASRLEQVPVRRLLDAAAERSRRRLERHRIALSVDCPEGIGEVTGDALQLEIVLHNLLGNAVEAVSSAACARREIGLSARSREGQVELRVEDTGPGLAREITDRLFQPFTTTKPDGMGMGLSISRSIVEAHGGRIRVEPGAGGCAVVVSIPQRTVEGE